MAALSDSPRGIKTQGWMVLIANFDISAVHHKRIKEATVYHPGFKWPKHI